MKSKTHFELRSAPMIGLAYIVGPLVGLTLVESGSVLADPAEGIKNLSGLLFMSYFGIGIVCITIELLLISPILIFLQFKYKSYLNWPYLCAGGFIIWSISGLMWQYNPEFGSILYYTPILSEGGAFGVIAAAVFYLIAVRTTKIVPSPKADL